MSYNSRRRKRRSRNISGGSGAAEFLLGDKYEHVQMKVENAPMHRTNLQKYVAQKTLSNCERD